mmetsp:Transcript_11030/g.12604  ORF Transcript_11030/g.12604 Transcript_11030/m.12604 type:complete len:374 (-) Transcript_11030:877-1998(-)
MSGSRSSKAKYLQRYLGPGDGLDGSDSESEYRKPGFGLATDFKPSKKRKRSKRDKKKEKKKKKKSRGRNEPESLSTSDKPQNFKIHDEDATDWKRKSGNLGPLNPFEEEGPVVVETNVSRPASNIQESDGSGSDSDLPLRGRVSSSEDEDEGDESESERNKKQMPTATDVTDSDSDSDLSVRRGNDSEEDDKAKVEEKGKSTGDAVAQEESLMGRNAATVYRDKRGKKLDMLNEFMQSREMAKTNAVLEKKLEYEWGVGKVDKQREEEKKQELEDAKNSNFSRFADDKVLNDRLKRKIRSGDPMASMIKSDPIDESKSKDPGKTQQNRPIYKGPTPDPNRFGIKPGYRWDGRDRGNGFEKKFLESNKDYKATI